MLHQPCGTVAAVAGTDMFEEIAGDSADDLIVLHDALDFGHCHLALGVPMAGRFAGIDSLEQLKVIQGR